MEIKDTEIPHDLTRMKTSNKYQYLKICLILGILTLMTEVMLAEETWKTIQNELLNLKIHRSCDPPFPRYTVNNNMCTCASRDMFKDAHGNIVQNIKNLEPVQWEMTNHNISLNGILCNNENKLHSDN